MTSTAQKTLDNLQAAFNGESNARARYLAFAAQADREGYGPVASLFRAAARAEQIHAANHARVIEQAGAKPVAVIEAANVRSTAENLQAAIEGESYERDVMYPEFVAQARADGSQAAIATFQMALDVEAEHARLYTEALKDLANQKGAAVAYFVCPVCGFTAPKSDIALCPVCATDAMEFEVVE
jgi:rubrerythrin